jgi:hypothetical protein
MPYNFSKNQKNQLSNPVTIFKKKRKKAVPGHADGRQAGWLPIYLQGLSP